MNAFKLVFLTKTCFKLVVRSVNIGKAIVFLVDPYYILNTTVLNDREG